jgi:hypothetical protein
MAAPANSVYSQRVTTRRRTATTLGLLLGMLALSLVPRGLVLCVADAHVQIEGGCELVPCESEQAAARTPGIEAPERCTDTPLLLPTLRKSSEPEARALPALAHAERLALAPVSRADAAPQRDVFAASGAALRALRSVVLIV